jgi:hypothetical protein
VLDVIEGFPRFDREGSEICAVEAFANRVDAADEQVWIGGRDQGLQGRGGRGIAIQISVEL